MAIDIQKPIDAFVGLLILLALWAGFVGYIITSITSVGTIEGLGVFGTIITAIGALLVGAYLLIGLAKHVKKAFVN